MFRPYPFLHYSVQTNYNDVHFSLYRSLLSFSMLCCVPFFMVEIFSIAANGEGNIALERQVYMYCFIAKRCWNLCHRHSSFSLNVY